MWFLVKRWEKADGIPLPHRTNDRAPFRGDSQIQVLSEKLVSIGFRLTSRTLSDKMKTSFQSHIWHHLSRDFARCIISELQSQCSFGKAGTVCGVVQCAHKGVVENETLLRTKSASEATKSQKSPTRTFAALVEEGQQLSLNCDLLRNQCTREI